MINFHQQKVSSGKSCFIVLNIVIYMAKSVQFNSQWKVRKDKSVKLKFSKHKAFYSVSHTHSKYLFYIEI